jgi:hypothetical protein
MKQSENVYYVSTISWDSVCHTYTDVKRSNLLILKLTSNDIGVKNYELPKNLKNYYTRMSFYKKNFVS